MRNRGRRRRLLSRLRQPADSRGISRSSASASSPSGSATKAAAQTTDASTATSLRTDPDETATNGQSEDPVTKPYAKSGRDAADDAGDGDDADERGAKPGAAKSSSAKTNDKRSKSAGSKADKKSEQKPDDESATEDDADSPDVPQLAYLDPSAGKTNWVPIAIVGGVVVTLCAAVAVVLLLAGGKPASKANNPQAQSSLLSATYLASRALYFQAPEPDYSVFLPAGWQTIKPGDTQLTNAIAVQSPLDSTATITVGQVANPASSLTREEHNLHSRAEKAPGYAQVNVGTTTLPGHRPAWQLTYTSNAGTNLLAVIPSCGNDFVLEAAFPAKLTSTISGRVAVAGNSLLGSC